jgi:hypothetical protein
MIFEFSSTLYPTRLSLPVAGSHEFLFSFEESGLRHLWMIFVLTLKRYAGALAPMRFTFIEDQEDRSAPLTEIVPWAGDD